jgi:hypothetical protein
MRGGRVRRRDVVAALVGAASVIVLAGGVAWAAIPSGGVIHGCYHKNSGQLRVVEAAEECGPPEVVLPWNQAGQTGPPGADGADGVSPTVTPLASGDANCPAGGAAITDAAGSTAYVCSGQDGADGEPFSGVFTSPNGEYSLSVTDTGVTMSHGLNVHVRVVGTDVFVRGLNVEVRGDANATLRAGANARVEGGAAATVDAGAVAVVEGSLVQIRGGGSCLPAARLGDPVVAPGGVGTITAGAPTVCVG